MTSTLRAAPQQEFRGHETGSWDPVIRPVAIVAFAVLLLLNSSGIDAINGVAIPNSIPLLAGLGGIGLACVIPRPERVMIPIAPTLLVLTMVLSVGWSRDPFVANLWLRSDGAVLLGTIALGLVLPNRDVIRGIKIFVAILLAITAVAVAIDPLARTHIDPLGEAPELPGWHGWFIHKNTMASFMIVALPAAMAFFETKAARWAAYATIVVLMLGSDSTTGRSALLVQVAVAMWFVVNRRLSSRGSATFAVSTAALMLVASAAVASSLAAIADAAGKDLTFTGRTEIWSAVISKIGDHPLIGHGIKGLFGIPYTVETSTIVRHIGFPAGHAHNGLLDVGLQLGALGIIIVVVQMVVLFRSSIAQMRSSRAVPLFGLTLAAGVCVMSVGESSLLDASVAVIFCAQAMLHRSARSTQRRFEVRRTDSTRSTSA